jgi:hypothetical protein
MQHNGLELEDTKGVIRSCKSKNDTQHNSLELEDTKGVIRSVNRRRTRNTMVYHCVACHSSNYSFWLSFWYLLTLDYCVAGHSSIYSFWLITPLVSSNSRPLCCVSFFDLQLLITPLVSSNSRPLCFSCQKCKSKKDTQQNGLELEDTKGVIRSSKSKNDYLLTLDYCVAGPSSIYTSDYPFGIF